jgi:hypothetical protein
MNRFFLLFLVGVMAAACGSAELDSGPDGGGAEPAPPGDDDPVTGDGAGDGASTVGNAMQTVFVIVMENHNWSSIDGSASAPYINDELLPVAAHAEAYGSLPGLHPSEPNYIWLEAGTDGGLLSDADPSSSNSIAGGDHLVTLLEAAGIPWKSYQEDMPPDVCPIRSTGHYAAKHNPFVFFQDVTDGNSASSARCQEHIRPLTELQPDLDADAVGGYVFITPNLCHDMHGASGCPAGDVVLHGDTWLSEIVPAITGSQVYQAGHAAILITWDESTGGDHPIGLIVVSPHARPGHAGTVPYNHSSTLRTVQEIFGVGPLLGDAANATSLADLFSAYP